MLPKSSNRIPLILAECHDTPSGGHSGFYKTFKRVAGFFFWEGMRSDIKRYVEECEICQRFKYSTLAPRGLLQPVPIST